MIRECVAADFEDIYQIINDAAQAYRNIIPPDRWKEPYMPSEELREELLAGVTFLGYEIAGELAGVVGTQDVQDVTLIRHAYVRTSRRNQGVGGQLLARIMDRATRPVLIGAWADAVWAVSFYEHRGFKVVSIQDRRGYLENTGPCRTGRSRHLWCWPTRPGSPPDRRPEYHVNSSIRRL